MSTEAWTLVGVVVGALLGGVAQLVADWLRRRHETRVLARNDRRDAYATFLSAASAALAPIAASRNEFQRQIMPPDFWPERSEKALMSAQEALTRSASGSRGSTWSLRQTPTGRPWACRPPSRSTRSKTKGAWPRP